MFYTKFYTKVYPNIHAKIFGFSLILGLFSILSQSQALAVVTVDGDVSPSLNSLSVTVTVDQVPTVQLKTGASDAELFNHLSLYISTGDPKNPIQVGLTPAKTTSITGGFVYTKFYWVAGTVTKTTSTTNANESKVVFTAQVFQTDTTVFASPILEKDDKGQFVQVQAEFNRYDAPNSKYIGEGYNTIPAKIYLSLEKPKEEPKGFSLTPQHKSLGIEWTPNIDVSYTGAKTKIPGRVLVMVFKDDEAENAKLKGHIIDLTTAGAATGNNETEVECTFGKGNPDHCLDCGDNGDSIFYIDTNQDDATRNHPGLTYFQTVNNNGHFTTPNLDDPSKTYTVVLQYEDGGARTACLSGQSKLDWSLMEANGEPEGKFQDPRCFIASAAFGSPLSSYVDHFRWARDTFLMPSSFGQSLVKSYYQYGEPLAETIKTHTWLQILVRSLLWPISMLLWTLQSIWPFFTPISLGFMLCLFLSVMSFKLRSFLKT